MPKPAKVGDPLTDFITTTYYNESIKFRQEATAKLLHPPENPVRIPCVIDTDTADPDFMKRFDPVAITGPAVDWDDDAKGNSIAVKVGHIDNPRLWGVLQGPCTEHESSHVVIRGMTWAFIYVTDPTHRYAEFGNLSVESYRSGSAKILTSFELGGHLCLIDVGHTSSNRSYVATLKEAWSGNQALCDVYEILGFDSFPELVESDVYVYDPLAAFDVLDIGDSLYVTLQDNRYCAINNAPCP